MNQKRTFSPESGDLTPDVPMRMFSFILSQKLNAQDYNSKKNQYASGSSV